MMTNEALVLTAVITVGTLLVLLTDRVRIDMVALSLLVLLVVLGLVPPSDAITGFARPAVVTLIGLFILSAALERSGVVNRIAGWITARAHGSEARLVLLLMSAAAGFSLLMNNVAAGAVILPAALSAARHTNTPASRLLIPVSYGTLLGGMATLFTTANLIASSALKDRGLTPLNLLSFLPTGGLMLLAGIVYMMWIGRKLLPAHPVSADAAPADVPAAPPRIARRAVIVTVLTLTASVVLDPAYIPVVMIAGALGMVFIGCLSMDDGYRAIDWKTIFLIAGMSALSLAIVNSGLAGRLGQAVVTGLGASGALAVYAGLYLLTVVLAQIMSGQVTALVVAPIAISAALTLNASPQAACVVVSVGCSTCFLLPNAHPVNLLMMTPGSYRTRDFWRVGIGLTGVCFMALLVALRLFWGI